MQDSSEFILCPITAPDGNAVIDIFNYYIENSSAAFPEHPVPYGFFGMFLEICKNYPSVVVKKPDGTVAGFGMLRPHNPMPAFSHTAEITYFIRQELTGHGLGSRMLAYLEVGGRKKGITTILASISRLNEGSIRFHTKHGFSHCGRFEKVGMKKGVVFDTIWMQKFI
jgi:L-amino acid N-acyltransferase YncA